ncbi:MAG: PucR family transcriptional regulator [Actinomycetota bacterium]
MLTVREVLALPVVRAGGPQVVAGATGLDAEVRWVHVSELADIAALLRGGELIFTTGIALPAGRAGQRRYVDELARAGASGLVVELGRRWEQVPPGIAQRAEDLGLPVAALHTAVPFVQVTETVHALIINAQYAALQQSEEAHRAFTGLSVEGASVADIVERAAQMSGHAVVLEDLAHRAVVTAAGPSSTARLLADWEARSRGATEPWLVVPVGPRSQRWARLVAPHPTPGDTGVAMVLERAAEALALNRLLERDQVSLEQQAHRGVVADLLADHAASRPTDEAAVQARARALGLVVTDRELIGVAVWSPAVVPVDAVATERRDRSLAEAVTRAVRSTRTSALVATVEPGQVLLLCSLPPARTAAATAAGLRRLSLAVRDQLRSVGWAQPHTVGVGEPVTGIGAVSASLVLAGHVAQVAASLPPSADRPYFDSGDVRLRGVLGALSEDPRLVAFADSELGRLRAHDARHEGDLVATLRAFLHARGNISALSRASHLSRPALYARLARIQDVLGVDLEDAESNLSLHVALLVSDLRG